MKRLKTFFFLLCCLPFAACDKEEPSVLPQKDILSLDEAAEQIGLPGQQFAFDLIHKIAQNAEQENILLSPYSILSTLNMAYNGANGSTKDAMAKVLKQRNLSLSQLNSGYKVIREHLSKQRSGIRFQAANGAFWDNNKVEPFEEFLDRLAINYDAEANQLDFSQPAAVETINDWVKSKTEDKIYQIIENIPLEESLFLVNAPYFQGEWWKPFPRATIEEAHFFPQGQDEPLEVPFMWQDDRHFFYEGEDFTAVDLPFADTSAFTMTMLMPREEQTLLDFIGAFNAEDLQKLYDEQLRLDRVLLRMPLFELSYKINLRDVLSELGMEKAFSNTDANFSQLSSTSSNIHLTRVKHQTYLNINDAGADGTQSAPVPPTDGSNLPTVLSFERPFLILLRDKKTNAIVFIGQIAQP